MKEIIHEYNKRYKNQKPQVTCGVLKTSFALCVLLVFNCQYPSDCIDELCNFFEIYFGEFTMK